MKPTRIQLLNLSLLTGLLSVVICRGQTPRPGTYGGDEVRRRVAVIMRETHQQGEFETIISGVRTKVWTRTRPSNETVEELRRYSGDSVLILSEYIEKSENPRERFQALEFLGLIGGSAVVEPLRAVIKNDPSPDMRDTALRWITQAPWEIAEPILREAAETDTDPNVRETARAMLSGYGSGK